MIFYICSIYFLVFLVVFSFLSSSYYLFKPSNYIVIIAIYAALQIRTGQWSITVKIWPLTAHIDRLRSKKKNSLVSENLPGEKFFEGHSATNPGNFFLTVQ